MNRIEPDWNLYRSFLAVLREKSLSAAARALNLTQPTIARHIDMLETALGVVLFVRSQRGLSPTEAALELAGFAETIEGNAAALLRAAAGFGDEVRGTIRITASQIIGAEVLPRIVAGLRDVYPQLEFELVLSNEVDNLLRRDADIAVRMVQPTQDALVVRKLGTTTLGFHAHASYLARVSMPESLADLVNHTLIGFDKETPSLRAMRSRLPELDGLNFAFRSDNDVAQLQAIRAGFGIGICQTPLARRAPPLVRLLPRAFETHLDVWLAMHENLRNTPRCRVAFDGLAAGLADYLIDA